jgi:hypothetical protein
VSIERIINLMGVSRVCHRTLSYIPVYNLVDEHLEQLLANCSDGLMDIKGKASLVHTFRVWSEGEMK